MKGRLKLKSIAPVEIIVSYISIGWAIAMFSDPAILNGTWSVLNDFANRWVFGMIAFTCASVKIIGVLANSLKMRYIGLLMSAFFWTFLSVANLMSKHSFAITTGFVVYSGIAVLCLWTSKEIAHGRK